MTFKAGAILDITETCDKLLEFFYFRKGSTVDLDKAQMELPFSYERYDIAVKKLESDGHIKIRKTKTNHFAQITAVGEIFYRTTSYQRLVQTAEENAIKTKRKEKFAFVKSVIEIVVAVSTVIITIWTFILDKKIEAYEGKINQLESHLDSIIKIQDLKTDTVVGKPLIKN